MPCSFDCRNTAPIASGMSPMLPEAIARSGHPSLQQKRGLPKAGLLMQPGLCWCLDPGRGSDRADDVLVGELGLRLAPGLGTGLADVDHEEALLVPGREELGVDGGEVRACHGPGREAE